MIKSFVFCFKHLDCTLDIQRDTKEEEISSIISLGALDLITMLFLGSYLKFCKEVYIPKSRYLPKVFVYLFVPMVPQMISCYGLCCHSLTER